MSPVPAQFQAVQHLLVCVILLMEDVVLRPLRNAEGYRIAGFREGQQLHSGWFEVLDNWQVFLCVLKLQVPQ